MPVHTGRIVPRGVEAKKAGVYSQEEQLTVRAHAKWSFYVALDVYLVACTALHMLHSGPPGESRTHSLSLRLQLLRSSAPYPLLGPAG